MNVFMSRAEENKVLRDLTWLVVQVDKNREIL